MFKSITLVQYVSIRIFPVSIYLFKVKNRNPGTICETCLNSTTNINWWQLHHLVSLLLNLNRFHTFWCLHCWISINKWGWDRLRMLLTSIPWIVHHTYLEIELHCENNVAVKVQVVPHFFAWPWLWVLDPHE